MPCTRVWSVVGEVLHVAEKELTVNAPRASRARARHGRVAVALPQSVEAMLPDGLRAWHARSVMFSPRVILYSSFCACISFVIYLFCRRPDAKLNDVGENGAMYFRCVHPSQAQLSCKAASAPPLTRSVLGTCLSFLTVFVTNMSMGRFWEARSDIGTICNHTRSLARKLLFTADDLARANDADRATIATLLRYERAFFALLLQDLRTIHDLDIVPEALLLASEKQRLLPVRRRSLMILGWMAVQVRQLARAGKITERHEVMLMDHLDELSEVAVDVGLHRVDVVHRAEWRESGDVDEQQRRVEVEGRRLDDISTHHLTHHLSR